MYQVSAQSCIALTNVAFFILSSMTPCASHIAFTMNQNWYGSSFPTPLNTDNFIALAILNYGGGGDGVEDGDIGGGVGGGSIQEILCLFRWIALPIKTFTSSSLSPQGDGIKGPVSGPLLPLFL